MKLVESHRTRHLEKRGVPGLPRWRRWAAPTAVLLASLVQSACVTTHNYLDPTGPRYEGRYAPPPATDGTAAPSDALRVVTFNTEFGRKIEGAVALLGDSEALRGADILLLQEVDPSAVERVAHDLRLNYVYFPGGVHPFSKRDFGAAILSPWPLDEARKIILPHAAFITNVRRAATSATVLRGPDRIRIYSVHLPAPGAVSDDERHEQVRVLVNDASRSADAVVIGGDFNSRSVGKWFEQAGYRWLTKDVPGTARRFHVWWSLDHVFARGLMPAGDGRTAGFVDSAGTSDHRVVWVRLR